MRLPRKRWVSITPIARSGYWVLAIRLLCWRNEPESDEDRPDYPAFQPPYWGHGDACEGSGGPPSPQRCPRDRVDDGRDGRVAAHRGARWRARRAGAGLAAHPRLPHRAGPGPAPVVPGLRPGARPELPHVRATHRHGGALPGATALRGHATRGGHILAPAQDAAPAATPAAGPVAAPRRADHLRRTERARLLCPRAAPARRPLRHHPQRA